MKTLFAYLAGAIDIDGRIFIARAQGYRRRLDWRQVPYYIATIALSDSSPIVPDLVPYLRVKRRQAELALTLMGRRRNDRRMKSEGVMIAPLGREPGLIAYECLECVCVTKRAIA
jgi:hypothetical protein